MGCTRKQTCSVNDGKATCNDKENGPYKEKCQKRNCGTKRCVVKRGRAFCVEKDEDRPTDDDLDKCRSCTRKQTCTVNDGKTTCTDKETSPDKYKCQKLYCGAKRCLVKDGKAFCVEKDEDQPNDDDLDKCRSCTRKQTCSLMDGKPTCNDKENGPDKDKCQKR